jgi:putative PEP-CTERM system TPR-repeat lipoprotein
LFRLVLGVVLVSLLGACGQTSYTVEERLERATAFEAEGNIRAAIIEMKNALQQEPGHAEARLRHGLLHLEVADGAAAHAELQRALDAGIPAERVKVPLLRAALLLGHHDEVLEASDSVDDLPVEQRAEALALRAHALLARGDLAAGGETLQTAYGMDPAQPDALYGLAWMDILSRRPDDARPRLDDLIERHPGFVPAYELRGDLERDGGDLDRAERAYSAGIEASHYPSTLRLKRAMTRIYREDYAGATEDLDLLSRQYRGHPEVNFAQGLVAFNQRRYSEAQSRFEEALARDGNHMPAVYYLGVTHFAQGRSREAESYLTRFAAHNPNINEASRLLALARMQEGDAERAERGLAGVLNRDPDDVAALRMMSAIHASQGRNQEALQHLRRVATLDPGSAQARAQLAFALMGEGASEEGLRELEAAIERDPDLRDAAVMLIVQHIRQGQYRQALEAANSALERDASQAVLHHLAGMAHIGLDDLAAAKAAIGRSLELEPGSPDASHSLALIAVREGDPGRARALYEDVLEYHPNHLQTLSRLMSLDIREGDTAAALARVETAMEAHPEAAGPRIIKAQHLLASRQPFDALEVLLPVREASMDDARYLSVLGVSQLASGYILDAARTFQRQIELQPNAPEPRYLLAVVGTDIGRTEDTLELLGTLEGLPDGHSLRHLAQVRAQILRREYEAAAENLGALRAESPRNAEVHALSGLLAARTGDPQGAAQHYGNALDLSARSSWVIARSAAQWRAGDRDGAIGTLEEWLAHQPTDGGVRFRLAEAYRESGNEAAAVDAYREVLAAAPENWVVMNNLAWLLRKDGTDEAVELAAAAVERAPDVPSVLETYGVVLLERGRHAEALDVLHRAVQQAEENRSIRYQYARALAQAGNSREARTQLDEILADDAPFERRTEAEALRERL